MEYNVDNADAKITFIDVVLGFMQMKNADVYVTGSNSKMLSYDILTQFRDREMCIRDRIKSALPSSKRLSASSGVIIEPTTDRRQEVFARILRNASRFVICGSKIVAA